MSMLTRSSLVVLSGLLFATGAWAQSASVKFTPTVEVGER
jgi:uncharacterized lipoprotein YajG